MITIKKKSLLEYSVIVCVLVLLGYISVLHIKNKKEVETAKITGIQIKKYGDAVNKYIKLRYKELYNMKQALGGKEDPGPRVCVSNYCEITYRTLINEKLLPFTESGMNVQKSHYKILLKREGAYPKYHIRGIIVTTIPLAVDGVRRYDLLAIAQKEAGPDSGISKSEKLVVGDKWYETSTHYPVINNPGLLAYRVGDTK